MLHKMLHNLRRGPQWGIVRCHHRPRSERYAPFIVVQCVGRSRIHTAEVGGSSPLAPTGVVEATTLPLVRGGSETDAEGSISGLTTLTEPSPRGSLATAS